MALVVLSIHLVVCIALIGLVLLQRSEGGALGIGGGSGALMSGRGAADALARMTSFAGGFFLITSLTLTVISGAARDDSGGSVFDRILPQISAPATPAPTTTEPAPAPEETAPDPTQSSLPADTQLAALPQPAPPQAAPAVTLGPSSAAASERAGPIQQTAARTPPATTRQPTTTPAATTAGQTTRQPATTQTTTARQPSTPTTTPATTPAANRIAPVPETVSTNPQQPRLTLPGATSAAASLGQPEAVAAESDEASGVSAVRRERAGPDQ
jgi:preprotein translocase subunit SecG